MILKPQQILSIIGLVWTLTGLTFVGIGSIYWFHFPYLLYLDEWHFLWAVVALSIQSSNFRIKSNKIILILMN